MVGGAVIGVLSPFIGGAYYGGILTGVNRAAGLRGGRVVAIQTLDAGAHMTVNLGASDFAHPVAWDQVDGFVSLPDSVDRAYVSRIRGTGKPVVLVGHEVAGLACPTVLADNTTGIRDAVTHLIEHGHRRIAFVGYIQATDIQERHDAYRATLTAHGIPPDPALFFNAADNLDSGVASIAEALLAAVRSGAARPGDAGVVGALGTAGALERPPLDAGDVGAPGVGALGLAGAVGAVTAVVAATDRNAIGVMRALSEGGVRIPEDCAVIGFDDTDVAPYTTPSLASVRQMLEVMGGTAVAVLERLFDAGPVDPAPVRVPTLLVPRGSCGCATSGPLPPSDDDPTPRGRLAARLETLLPPLGVRRAEEVSAWHTAVDHIAGGLDPSRALADLYAIRPQQDSLTIVARAVREYADEVRAADPAAVDRAVDAILSLAQVHGRTTFAGNWHLRATVTTQYEASMDLLHDREHDPRTLDWLARTTATAGCLGLWRDGPLLDVFPGWRRAGPVDVAPGPRAVAAFPPVELIDAVDGDDVLFVVPVKVNASDWGMLAIVGAVETDVQDGREVMNQCAALLTVALNLRDQQRRLHRAAYHDSLTGLPNRAAFVEALEEVGGPVTVLFLDLDGFKHINDSRGHAAGDRVLMHVADRIREHVHAPDLAARFGGDEFLILLHGPPGDIAERLQEAVGRPLDLGGDLVTVGVSIGITSAESGNADEILLRADTAMYEIKMAGRAVD